MSFSFNSLDKIIFEKNLMIKESVIKTKKTVEMTEKYIEKIGNLNHQQYINETQELLRMRNHANYCIEEYNNMDLMKMLHDHINNYIEQNNTIIKFVDEAMIKINNKKLMKLSTICAMTLKSVGVEETDLPECTKEVFTSSLI